MSSITSNLLTTHHLMPEEVLNYQHQTTQHHIITTAFINCLFHPVKNEKEEVNTLPLKNLFSRDATILHDNCTNSTVDEWIDHLKTTFYPYVIEIKEFSRNFFVDQTSFNANTNTACYLWKENNLSILGATTTFSFEFCEKENSHDRLISKLKIQKETKEIDLSIPDNE